MLLTGVQQKVAGFVELVTLESEPHTLAWKQAQLWISSILCSVR